MPFEFPWPWAHLPCIGWVQVGDAPVLLCLLHCLLCLSPTPFCHSRLALFWPDACFVLFLHAFPTTFVIFLWFGFSFLHVIPATDTSCHSLFLFIVLLHISFHAYPFIQKNLGLCRPDNVDWIKKVLGPICLCLPKSFCLETVFCGRSVFCGRFAFCYRLLSLAFLSLDLSCSLVFLVGLWALLFIGLSSSWAFGYGFAKKWASTFSPLSIWIAAAIPMRKLMQFSFVGCFITHMRMPLFSLSVSTDCLHVIIWLMLAGPLWACCASLGLLYTFRLLNSISPVLSLGLYYAISGFFGPFHCFWAPLSHFILLGILGPFHHFQAPLSHFIFFGHPRPVLSLLGSFVPFVFPWVSWAHLLSLVFLDHFPNFHGFLITSLGFPGPITLFSSLGLMGLPSIPYFLCFHFFGPAWPILIFSHHILPMVCFFSLSELF